MVLNLASLRMFKIVSRHAGYFKRWPGAFQAQKENIISSVHPFIAHRHSEATLHGPIFKTLFMVFVRGREHAQIFMEELKVAEGKNPDNYVTIDHIQILAKLT